MKASGFKPNEDMEIVLHSDPVTLGYTKADAAGSVLHTVHIPAGTPAGKHTVIVRGLESGAVTQGEITVLAVGSPSTGVKDLANTGAAWAGPTLFGAGALLLLGLLGVLFVSRRRAAAGAAR